MYKIAQGFYYTETQERVNTTPGITILLFFVTCSIYGYYCYYKWGRASTEIAARYGRDGSEKAVLYLVLAILGFSIVCDALIQSDFNDWLSIPTDGYQQQQYQQQYPPPPPGPGQGY